MPVFAHFVNATDEMNSQCLDTVIRLNDGIPLTGAPHSREQAGS